MTLVLITALGVGGATVIGALIGFIFKDISHKFSDIVLSFAAGIMLSAAVLGLIITSVEHGGKYGVFILEKGDGLAQIPGGFFQKFVVIAVIFPVHGAAVFQLIGEQDRIAFTVDIA